MGSPLSPAVANFFMEEFEHQALASAHKQPKHFFRYVDDTFVVWPHGEKELQNFFQHLNNQHQNIKFTMDIESDGALPFLDIMIKRRPDGSLAHSVYRKPTHTDLYLNADSHHHPAQKQGVLNTLFHRALAISDQDSRNREIDHLYNTLQQNGYKKHNINKAFNRVLAKHNSSPTEKEKEELGRRAYIPFYGNVSNKIARILKKNDITTVHLPPKKIKQMLRPVKDEQGLKTAGVYKIPCECGQVYIGQTGRTVKERVEEHSRDLRLLYADKSAVAQHAIEQSHRINFNEVQIVDRASHYWDRLIREAIEIKLEPYNFNRDNGLYLSKTWGPALSALRQHRAGGQHKAGCPGVAYVTPAGSDSEPDAGNAHCSRIGQRRASTSANRRATRNATVNNNSI